MVWAIGDIQGCYDPLMRLIEKIDFQEGRDRLCFAGDIVNRGNKSKEVVEFLYSIKDSVDIVLGNHDISLFAVYWGLKKPNHTLKAMLEAPDLDKWIAWMLSMPFVRYYKDMDFALVHAGIPPRFDLNDALEYNSILTTKLQSNEGAKWLSTMMHNDIVDLPDNRDSIDAQRYAISAFTRMRFCHSDGTLDFKHKGNPFEEGKESDFSPWFLCPNRKNIQPKIVFGHWSTLGYYEDENVSALDSGCLWRGKLTAKRMDTDMIEIVQVDCPEGISPYQG